MKKFTNERSPYIQASKNYTMMFRNATRNEKANFIQIQRLLWEKSLFPERFHPCSTYLCSLCSCKTNDLSFCIQCGQIYCQSHFDSDHHHCKPGFGIDIYTRQLFFMEKINDEDPSEDNPMKSSDDSKYKIEKKIEKHNRRFIFDSYIDRLICSTKFSVIDGVPIQNDFEMIQIDNSPSKFKITDFSSHPLSKSNRSSSSSSLSSSTSQRYNSPSSKMMISIFPQMYEPMPLQNFGNTCWMNSLLQCLAVNPLLQKWFLSEVPAIDCPEAAVHNHLTRFFLAQVNSATFSMADYIIAIWTMSPSFATSDQCDSHEFFMDLRTKLDGYYQKKFDSQIFSSIFNWQFTVIESCEFCAETKSFLEPASDLILNIENCSSLKEALSNFLLGSSPKNCSNCQKACKRQYFFNTLPPTLTIALTRASYSDRSVKNVLLCEELPLNDFIIGYKKKELEESLYSLVGIVVRPGSGEMGHYWANVKKWDRWYRCDDNSVTAIDFNTIMRDDACMLFYVRRGFVNS